MTKNSERESVPSPQQALAELWEHAGYSATALAGVQLSGMDPVLPSSFAIGTVAQVSIAATALAAAQLHHLRSGHAQSVAVDMRHATAEFRSERFLRVDGGPAPELWDRIAGIYRCGDDRWVRIHTNFPHHRDGILQILRCEHDKQSVAQGLQGWSAEQFEQAANDAGLVVAALRSFAEWDAHPQGIAVATLPLLSIERIGDAPAKPLSAAARPLSGVKVLDLTRIIAGPVCGRALAAHGAEVLLVTAPHLPSIEPLTIDTGRGKYSCQLDLRHGAAKQQMHGLLRNADIFVQGYRPGGLDALGFSAAELAEKYPGIVAVSLSAYGHRGPWERRRGFDSLVQTASGFNHAEMLAANADEPKALPAQALDHAAGYLLALGAMAALHRRSIEGGSWQVRVSLARTGLWLRSLGPVSNGFAARDMQLEDIPDLLEETPSEFGRLSTVRHAAQLSLTPARWERPPVALGKNQAAWMS
jgi:crotonobetainyl-CoA:carnitine CoA-transferase CaiB-like acyl-CoA transferase